MFADILKEINKGQEDWAFIIGVHAYVWGYPLVECWKDRLKKMESAGHSGAPVINAFRHARAVATPASREFVNAATDFLYSTAVIDLSDEPMMITAPNFAGRWYVLQVLDPYMETLANLGTRTFGDQVPPTLLCGPRWKGAIPPGARFVRCDSDYIYIVARIATEPGDDDLARVHWLQDCLHVVPLSEWNRAGAARSFRRHAGYPPLPAADSECPEGLEFFQELGGVLKYTPPKPDEAMLRALWSEVGLSVEHGFDHRSLSSGVKAGLAQAVPFAQAILARKLFEVGKIINGWGLVLDIGNYDKNYIVRALVAQHGIWANVPEESIYFMARTDAKGEVLHGGNSYEIRFEKGKTPPVDAFWSITYYDKDGSLIETPRGNNAVNSNYSNLHYGDDGSLTIYISQKDPGADNTPNWLYSHDGYFTLNLRCYNPRQDLLALNYAVPSITKVATRVDRGVETVLVEDVTT